MMSSRALLFKVRSKTCGTGITWEFARNAEFQAPPELLNHTLHFTKIPKTGTALVNLSQSIYYICIIYYKSLAFYIYFLLLVKS